MSTQILNQTWDVGASWNNGTANYTFRLEILLDSQSVANNTSTITINKYVKGNSGNSWYGTACSDVISGDVSDTISYNPAEVSGHGPMRNTEVLYHTKQATITHNNDGTKSLSISTTFTNGGNSYAPKTNSQNASVTLTTIPRASDISLSASTLNISSTSGSITYSCTSKANFYHTLTWTLGGSTTTISTVNQINNTTVTGTVSYTDLLAKLPSTSSGTLVFTLNTYSDSGKTTLVGTKTASCAITVTLKPTTTISSVSATNNPTGVTVFVAGTSKASIAWTATKPSGASTITTYWSLSDGTGMATSPSTATSGTATSNVLASNTTNGTYTVTVSAYTEDSRGNRSTTVTQNITVYGYAPPTATLSAFRTASNTSTTPDGTGAYLYITYSGAVSRSINGQNSITSTTCTATNTTGTVSNGVHLALATNKTSKVTLTVTDKIGGTNTQVVNISTASYPLMMYDDGQGNVGVGLGGLAIPDYITPYLPIKDVEQCFTVTTASTDLNDYKTTGIYYFTSSYTPTNIPIGVNGWLMVINAPNASQVKQMWWRQGTNGTNDFNTYVRQYAGGAWSSWTKYIMAGETVTRATGADGFYVTETNPTASATYYPVWVANKQADTVYTPRANDGVRYLTLEGTTDANGYGVLKLGNAIKTGTAGNKYGLLDLFDKSGGYYGRFTTVTTLTANRTYTYPNRSGTVLLQDATNYVSLFNGTLNSSTPSTDFTGANYSAYLIVGADLESTPIYSTMTIPRATITTTAKEFRFVYSNTSGNNYNGRFSLVATANTGGTITLTWLANGTIREVYGIR